MDFIALTNFIIIECCIMQHSLTVQKVNMKSTNLIGTQIESYALEEDGSQLCSPEDVIALAKEVCKARFLGNWKLKIVDYSGKDLDSEILISEL